MLSNLCYLNQVPGLAVCDRGGGLERRPGVCGQGEDSLVNMLLEWQMGTNLVMNLNNHLYWYIILPPGGDIQCWRGWRQPEPQPEPGAAARQGRCSHQLPGQGGHCLHGVQVRYLLTIYTLSTQYLHSIYTVSTQYLHSIYTISTQYLHTIYSVSTQYLHSIYTVFTQYLHSIYKLST